MYHCAVAICVVVQAVDMTVSPQALPPTPPPSGSFISHTLHSCLIFFSVWSIRKSVKHSRTFDPHIYMKIMLHCSVFLCIALVEFPFGVAERGVNPVLVT